MLMIWLVVIVLVIAVVVVYWMLINKQEHQNIDDQVLQHLENKVEFLQSNLQKTLEVVQDLAKKVHVQQEVIDLSSAKLKQIESENIKLINVLAKVVNTKD